MTDLFAVVDPWGETVRLTERQWRKLVAKHPEIEPYVDQIRGTIERPDRVYEGLSAADSKVFYSKRGVIDKSPFRGCHVAVIVRYTHEPAWIPSAYLPFRLKANLGKLLFPERSEGSK